MTDKLAGERFVTLRKVADYLLNPHHPTGASKARFFKAHGFSVAEPATLLQALSDHPIDNDVVHVEVGPFGTKSVVECRLRTPNARNPCIRTVWMLAGRGSAHRLVTAYPVAYEPEPVP